MNTTDAIEHFDKISLQVKTNFAHLSEADLNKKPALDKWSIAQCLDHLIVSNKTYYPQFEKVINGSHTNSFYQNIGFISRRMGLWLIKSTGPDKSTKMKNPTVFTPTQRNLQTTIIHDFISHQEEMKNYFSKMKHADVDKTVLSSPALGAITYSLSDLLQILCGHEQRHINQALEILNNR